MSGTASVAYASSLQFLNEKVTGPAFAKAEGYKYSGQGASSGELETNIASGEIHPNVFESVGGDNVTPLFPKFTKWYVQYAGTSMVVAYNPNGKYAAQFKAIADGSKPLKDLFTLLQTPGLKLGRTDPNIDPQGRDFIYMLELAQSYYHLPADTVTKILGGPEGSPTSPEIYADRRSTRPCNLVSSTRQAHSSPRPSSCTWTTFRCRLPSILAASHWRTSTTMHRSRSRRQAVPRRLSTARPR